MMADGCVCHERRYIPPMYGDHKEADQGVSMQHLSVRGYCILSEHQYRSVRSDSEAYATP